MAKVDEKAKRYPCCLEVIVQLGAVLIRKLFCSLQLDDDLTVADEIRFVDLLKLFLLVEQYEFRLRNKLDALFAELSLKALLIDGL